MVGYGVDMNDFYREFIHFRDNLICYKCGITCLRGKKKGQMLATIDHYIPKNIGGSDEPENLRTCCKGCNEKKGGKIPKDFTLFGHCYARDVITRRLQRD